MYSITDELSEKNVIYIETCTATSNKSYICMIWMFWHSTGDKNSSSLIWKGLVDWNVGTGLVNWNVGTGISEDLAVQKMKKASPSKMAVLPYQCTWCHIPQDWNPQIILVRVIMNKLYILRYNLMQNFACYTQNGNPFIMDWKWQTKDKDL